MLRITKNMAKITSIKLGEFDIDSFLLIPGITIYHNIYSNRNFLFFEGNDWKKSIKMEFASEGELERFFMQLMREIKINQITNVNVDTKTK